ncbi:hypothetical protein C8J56DRAFT_941105 [Mycena floridula]|nr:hypothetical protein C8J56DRAFT_941105 [Mycena floridula]
MPKTTTPSKDNRPTPYILPTGSPSEEARTVSSATTGHGRASSSALPASRSSTNQNVKDFKNLGYPDFGERWISEWDSFQFFGLRRNLLAQTDLTKLGPKKFLLSEIYALASMFDLPNGPNSQEAARREFYDKNLEVKDGILASFGLVDDRDDPEWGPQAESYHQVDLEDYEDESPEPDEETMHEMIREHVREKARERLGSKYDSEEDYGSEVTDEGQYEPLDLDDGYFDDIYG